MYEFAIVCLGALKIQVPAGMGVTDLCGGHARYVMYKAGPVLTVSVSFRQITVLVEVKAMLDWQYR